MSEPELFPAADTKPDSAAHKDKAEKDKPHYHGHRDRLRQRFMQGGADAMEDYELLELLLFLAIPRRDVKPLSKALISAFGSLSGVLNAGHKELSDFDGLSENTVIAIKSIQAAGHRLLKQEIMNQPILNSWSRLIDYCQATMAHEKNEQFRVLFLNKKNELMADEVQQKGTVDHTPAYPREIVKRALELGATAVILVHNHPSGDPSPSQADIVMTRHISEAAEALDIVVHDHIIVSKRGATSFRTEGLI